MQNLKTGWKRFQAHHDFFLKDHGFYFFVRLVDVPLENFVPLWASPQFPLANKVKPSFADSVVPGAGILARRLLIARARVGADAS